MPRVCPLKTTGAPCLSTKDDRCMPCYVYRRWRIWHFRHEGGDSGYGLRQQGRGSEFKVRTALKTKTDIRRKKEEEKKRKKIGFEPVLRLTCIWNLGNYVCSLPLRFAFFIFVCLFSSSFLQLFSVFLIFFRRCCCKMLNAFFQFFLFFGFSGFFCGCCSCWRCSWWRCSWWRCYWWRCYWWRCSCWRCSWSRCYWWRCSCWRCYWWRCYWWRCSCWRCYWWRCYWWRCYCLFFFIVAYTIIFDLVSISETSRNSWSDIVNWILNIGILCISFLSYKIMAYSSATFSFISFKYA